MKTRAARGDAVVFVRAKQPVYAQIGTGGELSATFYRSASITDPAMSSQHEAVPIDTLVETVGICEFEIVILGAIDAEAMPRRAFTYLVQRVGVNSVGSLHRPDAFERSSKQFS
jgi:hypothetical protein